MSSVSKFVSGIDDVPSDVTKTSRFCQALWSPLYYVTFDITP